MTCRRIHTLIYPSAGPANRDYLKVTEQTVIVISKQPLLSIPYQSEGFPDNVIKESNGRGTLLATWDDILWSAITIGRPKSYCMFEHGESSIYEAIFRFSLVNMALENSELVHPEPKLTSAAKNLDPTEKGMVNYFLGMTLCKLFSSALLGAPWLLHLDVWRSQLNIKLSGRSRPDLIGNNDRTGEWYGFECKGRVSRPDQGVKDKAKEQATRIASVNGISCSLHVAAITYFVNDVINFYWCDPPPREGEGGDQIELRLPDDVWQNYYGLVAELITPSEHEEGAAPGDIRRRRDAGHWYARIEQCDVEVSVHRLIGHRLVERDWDGARLAALEATEQLTEDGFHADGLHVRAGNSWDQRGGPARRVPS